MSHDHQHSHAPANYNRIFAVGILLNIAYVAVEAGFGFAVDSLALLADAGHNLSDVLGLLLAWAGHYLSQRKPTARLTYGLRSSSILAAFFNALLLMAAVGAIAWEAIKRFSDSVEVPGTTIMIVAGIGVGAGGAATRRFDRVHQTRVALEQPRLERAGGRFADDGLRPHDLYSVQH